MDRLSRDRQLYSTPSYQILTVAPNFTNHWHSPDRHNKLRSASSLAIMLPDAHRGRPIPPTLRGAHGDRVQCVVRRRHRADRRALTAVRDLSACLCRSAGRVCDGFNCSFGVFCVYDAEVITVVTNPKI